MSTYDELDILLRLLLAFQDAVSIYTYYMHCMKTYGVWCSLPFQDFPAP